MANSDNEYDLLTEIDAYRASWENTRNPIFVWKAIDLCFMTSARRTYDAKGKLPPLPLSEPHPIPGWCLAYLGIVASRITTLADGRDYRISPAPFGDAPPHDMKVREASLDAPSTVSSIKAADLSVWALGLRRTGSTAFEDFNSLEEKRLDLMVYEELTSLRGLKYEAAMEVLSEEAGVEKRGMAKRLKAARNAERTQPAPAPDETLKRPE